MPHSVRRLSARVSVMFRCRDRIRWNTSKIISRLISLSFILGLTQTWATWSDGNAPKIRVESERVMSTKICSISETCKVEPRFLRRTNRKFIRTFGWRWTAERHSYGKYRTVSISFPWSSASTCQPCSTTINLHVTAARVRHFGYPYPTRTLCHCTHTRSDVISWLKMACRVPPPPGCAYTSPTLARSWRPSCVFHDAVWLWRSSGVGAEPIVVGGK